MYTKNKHLLLISSVRVPCAKSSALTKSTVKALKFYFFILIHHQQINHRQPESHTEHKQAKGQTAFNNAEVLKNINFLHGKLMRIIFRCVLFSHHSIVKQPHTFDTHANTMRHTVSFRQFMRQWTVTVDSLSKQNNQDIHKTVQNSRNYPQHKRNRCV